MLTKLRTLMSTAKDRGASAVEYGLMVAAIAAVIVGIVFGLGQLVGNQFDKTCRAIDGKTAATDTAVTPGAGCAKAPAAAPAG